MTSFNKVLARSKMLLGALVAVAVISVSSTAYAASGGGRATIVYAGPHTPGFNHVQFNSVTNVPKVGDERNFLTAKMFGGSAGFRDPLRGVQNGDVVLLRVYVHNNADIKYNYNPGRTGIAHDTRVRVALPAGAATHQTPLAFVSAANATPSIIVDDLSIYGPQPIYLKYVPGTATVETNTHQRILSDQIVDGGVQVGDDNTAGDMKAGFAHVALVTLKVRVIAAAKPQPAPAPKPAQTSKPQPAPAPKHTHTVVKTVPAHKPRTKTVVVTTPAPQPKPKTVVVAAPAPGPGALASTCDMLEVAADGTRTAAITVFRQTARGAAEFDYADINWGDGSTNLTTNDVAGQHHHYAVAGAYRVVAVAHYRVGGRDFQATSPDCEAVISLAVPAAPVKAAAATTATTGAETEAETEEGTVAGATTEDTEPNEDTQSDELVNAGATDVLPLFAATVIIGALGYHFFIGRRNSRKSEY